MPKGHFVRTEEHKNNIRLARLGKKRDPAIGRRSGATRKAKGRKWTQEEREKILAARGPIGPRTGAILSEETKQKLRDSHLNRSPLLAKYGVTDDVYAANKAAGFEWCFFKKHFVPSSELLKNQGVCLDCRTPYNRERMLYNKYGVTQEWFDAKLAEQHGGCAICGNPTPDSLRNHLNVDHDHANGKNRGILCSPCNHLMERLDEVPGWFAKAIAYQMRYRREHEAAEKLNETNHSLPRNLDGEVRTE